jgi:trimethylamine--corrinoid protein Co-methyltransferase
MSCTRLGSSMASCRCPTKSIVMDTDMCGALHSYLDGMAVNEDTLAFEALNELGPGQHLFSTQHTLRHYETAYWDSALDDNQPWETWDEQGGIDYAQRANTRWKKILPSMRPRPLDQGIDEALLDFIARRKDVDGRTCGTDRLI